MPISGSTLRLDARQVDLSTGVRTDYVPYLSDAVDIGSPDKLIRTIHASELYSVLFSQNTVVLLGSRFVVGKGQGALSGSVAAADTQIDFTIPMTPNDFVLFRVPLKVEYIQVGTLASGSTVYNVTRNLDGSGANIWNPGDIFLVLGNTGNGRIELNVTSGSPRLQFINQGNTYNGGSELVRIGDLQGNWGYASSTYGAAFGEYAVNKPNLTIDPTNGMRIRSYTTNIITLDTSGSAYVSGVLNVSGSIIAGESEVQLTGQGLQLDSSGISKYGFVRWYDSVWGFESARISGITQFFPPPLGSIRLEVYDSFSGSTLNNLYLLSRSTSGSVRPLLYTKENFSVNGWASINKGLYVGDPDGDPSDNDVIVDGGIYLGRNADPGNGNVAYSGSLISYKNSTEYSVYGYHPLATQLTSTSWDGDSHSTTAKTLIDLSSVFSAPAGIKAVDLVVVVRDSASSSGTYYMLLSPNNTAGNGKAFSCAGYTNDQFVYYQSVIPCNSDGDIYYQIVASGANTFDVYIEIWGYYI